MWRFLGTLAGGLLALLGGAITAIYGQRQALKAERRARAAQAGRLLVKLFADGYNRPRVILGVSPIPEGTFPTGDPPGWL